MQIDEAHIGPAGKQNRSCSIKCDKFNLRKKYSRLCCLCNPLLCDNEPELFSIALISTPEDFSSEATPQMAKRHRVSVRQLCKVRIFLFCVTYRREY